MACNAEWEVPIGQARTLSVPLDVGKFPKFVSTFHVAQCNHCDHPPCVLPCPTGATYQAENGIVKSIRSLCIGCGYCVEACPMMPGTSIPATNKVESATSVRHGLERGEQPACVNTCTAHAKYFGDLEDPQSYVFRLVYEKHARRLRAPTRRLVPMSIIWESPGTSIWCLATFRTARAPPVATGGSLEADAETAGSGGGGSDIPGPGRGVLLPATDRRERFRGVGGNERFEHVPSSGAIKHGRD